MARVTQAQWDAKRAEVKAQAAVTVAENAQAAKDALAALRKEQGYPAPGAVASEDESDEGYDTWSKADLATELEARGLAHSGNKDELVARLQESDSNE